MSIGVLSYPFSITQPTAMKPTRFDYAYMILFRSSASVFPNIHSRKETQERREQSVLVKKVENYQQHNRRSEQEKKYWYQSVPSSQISLCR